MYWSILFLHGVLAAPFNRNQFQADIENEIRVKLSNLNMTQALAELQGLKDITPNLDDKEFSDRVMVDGFIGVLDPGSSIPGSRYIGKHLSSLIEVLQLGQVAYEVENSLFGGASCTACKAGLMFLSFYIHTGVTKEQLLRDANMMCSTFRMIPPVMCTGLVESFGPEIFLVVKGVSQSPEEMCGFMFGQACNNPHNPVHEWEILLPPVPKPEAPVPPASMSPSFKVLHMSDTHWDPFYLEGTNANCELPLCCRKTSGPPVDPEDVAGYWGDYRKCDVPLRTIESMYRHIQTAHRDVDFIYWTGDLPPHDIWNQTRAGNIHVLEETSAQLRKYFPGIPILPALGNHESVPVDSFPPPFVQGAHSIDWLYSALDREWSKWIGPGHSPTLRYGGYYSVNIGPGLRVISMNMNYCMNKNFWLLLNSTDPAQELKWLVYELQLAEFKGEKVHIIGHIPPGHVDCVKVWSRNFNQIINRYEHTVTAQFYGHTHVDEFEIFYDLENRTRPINIAYIGPSVTTYYGLNPTYRIYEVSGESGMVLDHETWYMDLHEANHGSFKEPVWRKLYSVKEAYKFPSLDPVVWNDFVQRMDKDTELFSMFYNYYHSGSALRPECDPICRRLILCNLRTSLSHSKEETCNQDKNWSYLDIFNWFY